MPLTTNKETESLKKLAEKFFDMNHAGTSKQQQGTKSNPKNSLHWYNNMPPESKPAYNFLLQVNNLMAKENIVLANQSEAVNNILKNQLKIFEENTKNSEGASDFKKLAIETVGLINEQLSKETKIAQERVKENQAKSGPVVYTSKPIHQRTLDEQRKEPELQDHDVTRLMPESEKNIDVIGILDLNQKHSIEPIAEGVKLALDNKKIEHIFIPIGPGHWRGASITKPAEKGQKYKLELFDPISKDTAKKITDGMKVFLQSCDIDPKQVEITYTSPKRGQSDYYACGDFVCANFHKKKKDLLGNESSYYANYVETLESVGNKDDRLRECTRIFSKRLENHPDKNNLQLINQEERTQTEKQAEAEKQAQFEEQARADAQKQPQADAEKQPEAQPIEEKIQDHQPQEKQAEAQLPENKLQKEDEQQLDSEITTLDKNKPRPTQSEPTEEPQQKTQTTLEEYTSKFSSAETHMYEKTLEAAGIDPSSDTNKNYKTLLAELISNRKEISQKANKAHQKAQKGEQLSDEEVALQQQDKEFRGPRLKPR